ncbi:MAG TPA: T9SS type A sorting domain-containing protein [Flavipsychrobacter sp.]|nr:T9SS type A sorting domain-containing protein [Flavipsychrobacter sp.]
MVRNLLFLVFILQLIFVDAYAQNMVTNGNFETYTSCPSNFSQTTNAPPWRAYHAGSSDYFHTCGNPTVAVPVNTFGWQNPASGNAYAGGYAFPSVSNVNGYTEYIAAPITPLTVGAIYEVSMSLSLSNNSGTACNGMGAWFYDNGPSTTLTGVMSTLSVTPQILYPGVISDTQNWVRVTAIFLADSAYDNIVIGRFNPSGGLTTTSVGMGSYAYYYIDSVVVKIASGINNLYADSMICAGDTFQVPYTLNNSSLFNSGNVFSVQLSNSSGSFASGTTTIGTRTATTAGSIACVVPTTVTPGNNYRIRIRSTNTVDSSMANTRDISIGVVRPNVSNSNNGPLCTGQQLNLTATSTTTGVSYKWTGPAGFNSTVQNPVISSATTANSGDYIVTARLFGCTAKDTTTATIVAASASTISAGGSTPICERDTLYLTANVGTVANSYSWAGPGGFTANSKDTIRANSLPAMSGDYIFTAQYTGCTLRDTVTIEVKPQAAARTIGSNSPVCTDNTLTLNAGSSSTGVAYTWTGPNSFVNTTSSPSISGVTLSNAGRYVVTYLLNGCVTKDSLLVTVNQSPLPVTASANTPLCEGSTINLSSTNSTGGATYSWAGPGSYSATSQNPTRINSTPAMSGDYIVTAMLSNGCIKRDTVTVLVKPMPANFSAGSNSPVCEGGNLQLTGNTSSTGVSFSWTGPLSYSSTTQNPTITGVSPSATGDYILAGTLNGCTMRDTVYALINANPSAPTAGSNTPVCTGQDIQLTASAVSGATSYTWVGPGGYSATGQNPIRSAATSTMAGVYTVRAIRNGCASVPANTTVAIVTAPNVNLYPSPKDSICQGATVTFVVTPSNVGVGPIYTWYRNNNPVLTGGTSFPTSAVNDMDEFYVTVTTNGVCSGTYTDTSNSIIMRVLPYLTPSVSITANPNTTVLSGTMINFTANPVNGGAKPTYQWTRNGANITGALSNVWGASTLSNNDQICVDMTSNYLCPSPKTVRSNCIKVSIESTGVANVWAGKLPSVYPNPAKDRLIIEGIEKGTKIQLNDVIGRKVIDVVSASTMVELNTAHLAAGSYMLMLYKENGDSMGVKVVKE